MKLLTKLFHISPILLIATMFIPSCSKISDNGDLDGKWHLIEMYSKNTPTEASYTQKHETYGKGIYWMFQLDLLNIITREIPENVYSRDIIARFNHSGNQLHITETYVHFRERDSLLTDPSTTLLEPVGIRGNATTFNIKELNSSKMILTSPFDSLVFKKK